MAQNQKTKKRAEKGKLLRMGKWEKGHHMKQEKTRFRVREQQDGEKGNRLTMGSTGKKG